MFIQDYNAFLDFVLAVENTNTPESITYCFKVLDIHQRRFLDESVLKVFFREVLAKMIAHGHEPIPIDDVLNEIFDMANPKDLSKITLQGMKFVIER